MESGTARAPAPVQPNGACGWRCPEHSERLAELFCHRCGRCVCTLCPVLGAHRGHPVGLAEEEAARVQKLIQDCLECLATKKRQHADNIAHLEDAGERLKAHADSSKAWLTQKFTELRLLLDEEEVLAKNFIDKNTQLTLQVYSEQADSCRKQIEVIDDFSTRVWAISLEPNPVQLLQAYIATKSEMGQQMSPSELSHPVPLSFEPVKNFFKEFMGAIRDTFQTPMDTRLKESELPNDFESLFPVWLGDKINLRKEPAACHGKGLRVAGAGGSWSHCICNWKAEGDGCWHLAHSCLSVQCGTPVDGVVFPTVAPPHLETLPKISPDLFPDDFSPSKLGSHKPEEQRQLTT